MLVRDINDYGGIRTDAKPSQNPESEVAASQYNRLQEDVAQLTRPGPKAIVYFDTHAWAGSYTYPASAITTRAQWGTGDSAKPTVSQTAAGRYTLTWSSSYADALSVSESLSFIDAECSAYSSDPLDDFSDTRPLTVTSNAVTIVTKAGGAAADVGDNSAAVFRVAVRVW